MAKHKHGKTTIEINGKLYDPRTGRQVGGGNIIRPTAPRQSIDGVIGAGQTPHKPSAPQHHTAAHHKTTRPPAKHAKRQVAKSQTLVRKGLEKPAVKPHPTHNKTPESLLHEALLKRQARARQIQKNRLVQRFNMQAEPAPKVTPQHKPLPVATQRHHSSQPLPSIRQHHSKPLRQNTIQDFEEALKNATSHMEKPPKKSRKRILPKATKLNVTFVSLTVLLLSGFFAWQSMPNLQMRLAASRANVDARLPAYSPVGYDADSGIISEPGKVTVSFTSNIDDQYFNLSQEASGWNSEALYANYVLPRDDSNQVLSSEDKEIYLFDDSTATWVDNGIWYRIEGTADLTTEQLQRIANSL
jgi:hypothetical protein